MKGQSDNSPNNFVESNGKTQVIYNITQTVVTDEHGTRTVYNYDYVEIEGTVTKQKVIDAINKISTESIPQIIVPDDVFTGIGEASINKEAIKTAYITAITTLQNIQTTINPTNAQVVAAVKAEAAILEKLLKFLKSQIN